MLSDEDKQWIREEMKVCNCGLSGEAIKELPHFFGMVKDIGDGDVRAGVETFRVVGVRTSKYARLMQKVELAGVTTLTGYMMLKLAELIVGKIDGV